jgi:hypothetical protein
LQLLGLSILAIGVWAWTEKDTFNNLSLLTNIALDPAFIFILAGEESQRFFFSFFLLWTAKGPVRGMNRPLKWAPDQQSEV